MKNGMIRIGMFEAYLERMLIRGIRAAYISYFTRTLQEAKAIASTMCTTEQNTIWLNKNGQEKRYNVFGSYKAYYVQRLETICSFQKKKLQEKNFMKF